MTARAGSAHYGHFGIAAVSLAIGVHGFRPSVDAGKGGGDLAAVRRTEHQPLDVRGLQRVAIAGGDGSTAEDALGRRLGDLDRKDLARALAEKGCLARLVDIGSILATPAVLVLDIRI